LRPTKTRTRRRSARAAALAALLFAGGCGGEEATPPQPPTIEQAVAERIAATSDEIAVALDDGDVCKAAGLADDLNAQVVAAINARRIPPAFQEDLQSRANELVNAVNCPPPPAVEPEPEEEDDAGDEDGERKPKKKDKKDEQDEQDETIELPVEPPITETDG
jgi:hypothetical protein